MSIPEQLKTDIKTLTKKDYIKKPIRTFIRDNLEFVSQYAEPKEQKQISKITYILSKPDLKIADKNELVQSKKFMVNMVKKYEEEFNEESNEDSIDLKT